MIDLFPYLRATFKNDDYFADALGEDSEDNFKSFKGDESPTAETIFQTIDVAPVDEDPNSNWVTPAVTITFHGKDTDWPVLYRMAREAKRLLRGNVLDGYGQAFTANAVTDTLSSAKHGLEDGDRVLISTEGSLPGNLASETVYYVVESTEDTFQLAEEEGGAAIDLSSAGTGPHRFTRQALVYEAIGKPVTSEDRNPVTDTVTLSLAQELGFAC